MTVFRAMCAVTSGIGLCVWGCVLLTDTDGLSGGSLLVDGGSPETGPSADAPAPDVDAGSLSDATSATDAGGLGCDARTPPPKFCDDFERPSAQIVGPWEGIDLTGGGFAALDGLVSRSPAQSLLSSLPLADAGESHAGLYRTFLTSAVEIRYGFDWRIDAAVTRGEVDIGEIGLRYPSGGTLYVKPVLRADGAFFRESDYRSGQSFLYHPFRRSPVYGQWERVEVKVTFGTPAHLLVQLGQDVVVDDDFMSANVVAPISFDAWAGVVFNVTPASAFTMHTDNVTVDWL